MLTLQVKKESRRVELASQRSESMKKMHEARREKAKQAGGATSQAEPASTASDKKVKGLADDLTLPGANTSPPQGCAMKSDLPPDLFSSLLQVSFPVVRTLFGVAPREQFVVCTKSRIS